ncbi:MAG: ribosome maturation factor RimM [Bryobacteraceae bacterium]
MSLPETGWVAVALLGRTRGNRGEVTAWPLSDKPERYQELREVYLEGAGVPEARPYTVEEVWFHQGVLVFKFQGVDTISDAERLYGAEVRVPSAERVALGEGEYFQSDLVGCEVIERASGRTLGRVTGWEDGGGAGLLVVDSHWLIPFARSICVEIDPAAGRIAVDLPAGLKDVNLQ